MPSGDLPGERVWSASGRGDAFAQWREVVCQAFTRLSPERVESDTFTGRIRARPIGAAASVSQITASPQHVLRRKADVAARPCDAVFVNIQIAGTSIVRQREIETRLVPGSLTLLDARQPFDMRFDTPFRQICLHLPIDRVKAHGLDTDRAIARRVDSSLSQAAAVIDQARSAINGESDGPGEPDDLLQLLMLCYADGRADTLADKHLSLIRQFVARNCEGPDLTPAMVAARFRISVRYLHRLFARSGESFGRYLLRCRLRQSRTALLIEPDRSVTDIALSAGFRDTSHFSRSFKARYGQSPSALRKAAR